ncbi:MULTISPECIES: ABC transporter permease subunit [Corallincola]|uniref:ABC transporter permease subunit n=3 Tax=Corallincola TaxID=1775176 RepID=A0A368NGT0_9GAMM|nr:MULTISPECIES: ABC transporter permease subunit [Corallincola]RCU49093.1 ABC transporter permease subunit [Corallincola holothuriorum]TAA47595.1 ABC transporter permease subunit [Corallincola spongiicola]TCI05277.1 ABC transporter permease subunit [Corallincola luteus]
MAANSVPIFRSSRRRLFKDNLARFGVTGGGLMVLVALLLIFFYLLYVVLPIFTPVDMEQKFKFEVNTEANVVSLGIEEQAEIGYRFAADGQVAFFAARDLGERKAGDEIYHHQVVLTGPMTASAAVPTGDEMVAYADAAGMGVIVKPQFRTSFPNDVRVLTPEMFYPLGDSPLLFDPQGAAIEKLAVALDDESASVVSRTSDHRIVLAAFSAEEDFLTEEVVWTPSHAKIDSQLNTVQQMLLTPDQNHLFIRGDNRIEVWNLRNLAKPTLKQVIDLRSKASDVSTMGLLTGASSLLIGYDNGDISQWFEVNGEQGRKFQRIRGFKSDGAVTEFVSEKGRKGFMVTTDTGNVAIYHTTGQSRLFEQHFTASSAEALTLAPRHNAALLEYDGDIYFFDVENEYPEVTFSALWTKVWYEGYPDPQYVWQSTSGSDEFEPKLSLMPLTFGTIKAALYAMLIAVPIALAGAIYTAYFMTPSMRTWVKPTVEIMEALPTVILGFLAGLWLAPYIEDNLPGILAILILVPFGILLSAYLFNLLPKDITNRLPDGWQAAMLVPVVIFFGWAAFALSPGLEDLLFEGNARVFITNELGISFDQRNALVVGLAMGFAVIPTIFSIAEDAVFSVPGHLSNGSLALGATRWQTLTRVVLLTASPGIFSAVMMGLGRAVGETMIVLMATGNTPMMDWSIFQGMRTLSANIAVEMPEAEVGSSHYRILFLSAFVLFVLTFIFNTISEFVRQRLREKYSSM